MSDIGEEKEIDVNPEQILSQLKSYFKKVMNIDCSMHAKAFIIPPLFVCICLMWMLNKFTKVIFAQTHFQVI